MKSLPVLAYVVAGGVALSVFTGWQGYRAGNAACEAANAAALRDTQSDLFDLADRLSVTSARLVAEEAVQTVKSEGIEHEARNDFDPCRVPSDSSLQRLKRRWAVED
ncbi:hypothetical protein [Shimia sagamensis]|uniref:Uncharacterized protein n=1 Tax=Shimia sagamensis TaxID=1566352 RepID=A0ABY1PG53_9RHOB|nr:hypothetical protein [Shimia sagamensis]SMP32269.1 hypothetical protein SAMN06265373_108153 [Shimia sagamensis]